MNDHRQDLRALRRIYKKNRFHELRRAILYGHCQIKVGHWPLPCRRIPLRERGFYDDRPPQMGHNVLSLSVAKLTDAVEHLIPKSIAMNTTEDSIQSATQLNVNLIRTVLDNLAASNKMMLKHWTRPTFDWKDILFAALASDIPPAVVQAVHLRMAKHFGSCQTITALCQPSIPATPQSWELFKSGDSTTMQPSRAWIPAQLVHKMQNFETHRLMADMPRWLQGAHRLTARIDRDHYMRTVEDAYMHQRIHAREEDWPCNKDDP